jgi:hypothetical protein
MNNPKVWLLKIDRKEVEARIVNQMDWEGDWKNFFQLLAELEKNGQEINAENIFKHSKFNMQMLITYVGCF